MRLPVIIENKRKPFVIIKEELDPIDLMLSYAKFSPRKTTSYDIFIDAYNEVFKYIYANKTPTFLMLKDKFGFTQIQCEAFFISIGQEIGWFANERF